MRGDRERFLARGCAGYISKPIETARFAAEVERYAARGRR
jgi:CheY-like chemotaxis protein